MSTRKRLSLIFALALASSATLNLVYAVTCDELFWQLENFSAIMNRDKRNKIDDSLARSPQFLSYLRNERIHWPSLPDERKISIAARYLVPYFKQYKNEPLLAELQERSLHRALQAHGAQGAETISGRRLLADLSAQNLIRLMGVKRYVSEAGMKKAESLVAMLEFAFPHNTTLMKGKHGLVHMFSFF